MHGRSMTLALMLVGSAATGCHRVDAQPIDGPPQVDAEEPSELPTDLATDTDDTQLIDEQTWEGELQGDLEVYEIDYADGPFSADLDGDGTPEKIAWTCEDPMSLKVGKAKISRALDMADMVGCELALVALDSTPAPPFVLYVAIDHEEVGPPTPILYRYHHGKLDELWFGHGEFEVGDGFWLTHTWSCDETHDIATVAIHRWDGERVVEQLRTTKTPNDGLCDEP